MKAGWIMIIIIALCAIGIALVELVPWDEPWPNNFTTWLDRPVSEIRFGELLFSIGIIVMIFTPFGRR